MKLQQPGGFRFVAWTGAALMLAFLGGAPREAGARFYQPQEGPYPEGDPEADDQPSPTPKLNRNKVTTIVRSDGRGAGKAVYGRLIWLNFVGAWVRISLH